MRARMKDGRSNEEKKSACSKCYKHLKLENECSKGQDGPKSRRDKRAPLVFKEERPKHVFDVA